jgi:predicted RNase H-like HicB family nuclease
MAVDAQTFAETFEYAAPVDLTPELGAKQTGFTAIAVFTQGQWSAICWQLDLATQANTLEEAMTNLDTVVKEALKWAAEEPGRVPGEPVPDETVRDILLAHDERAAHRGAVIRLLFA